VTRWKWWCGGWISLFYHQHKLHREAAQPQKHKELKPPQTEVPTQKQDMLKLHRIKQEMHHGTHANQWANRVISQNTLNNMKSYTRQTLKQHCYTVATPKHNTNQPASKRTCEMNHMLKRTTMCWGPSATIECERTSPSKTHRIYMNHGGWGEAEGGNALPIPPRLTTS